MWVGIRYNSTVFSECYMIIAVIISPYTVANYYGPSVSLGFGAFRPVLLKQFTGKVWNFHLQVLLFPTSQNATQCDHMTALYLLIIPLYHV